MDCSLPGSSVHGIFQARVLGWGAIAFSEVQTKDIQINYHFSSVVRVRLTLRSHDCSMPGFPVHHQLWELTQTHVYQVSDAIQPSHPVSFSSPPAFKFPSIRVFSSESVLIRWPKYWIFSFSISPSNEYSGLISFRIDWFDHLAIQEALKSLL